MRTFVACLSLSVAVALYAETPYERNDRYQGAQATLQLTVRDDRGEPVEGAYVQAYFWQPTSDAAAVGAYTDEKGCANVVGNGYTDVRYSVSKDGYYRTRGSARLSLPENDPTPFWKNYQWAPIIRETVIRKVRRPVSGVLHLGEWLSPPQTDVPIGLDLQLMDWMPPHGRGSHCDVVVKFVTRTLRDNGHAWEVVDSIALEFPNEHDGVLLCDAAPYSAFITPYHVPENGDFVACYRLTASEKEGTFFLPDTQTLLFRIRSKEGAGGAIVSAHYGSIFRCVMTGGMVSMDVFLNPTPNDTNIEYDPKRSLAKSYADRRWEATQKRLEEERKMLEEMGVENFIRAIRAKRSGASGTPKQEAKGAAE